MSIFRIPVEAYNGSSKTPVLEWRKDAITPMEALRHLTMPAEERLICKEVPSNVGHNTVFRLSTEGLKNSNDWRADDMGAWRNLGSYSCFFKMKRSGGIRQLFVDDELYSDPRKRRFEVTKAYFKNRYSMSTCVYC